MGDTKYKIEQLKKIIVIGESYATFIKKSLKMQLPNIQVCL